MAETVTMPKLGFDMAEGVLVRWVVSLGGHINRGEVLAEIETDKATVEVESSHTGTILQFLVSEGDIVPVNAAIAIVGAEGEKVEAPADSPAPKKEAAPEAVATPAQESTPVSAGEADNESGAFPEGTTLPDGVRASPVARNIAREKGIDLRKVKGTGPHGRIIKKDVESYTPAPVAAPAPAPLFSPAPTPVAVTATDTTIPLTKLRQAIARRMTESKQYFPHFYVSYEYNLDKLMAVREQANAALADRGVKLSVNDFILKAVALTLRDFPNLNASLGSNEIVRHGHYNIGVAVAVDAGLLTVVVKDADQKSLSQIATEVKAMSARAREGKVKPEDVDGSTFTTSNLGMYGVDDFIAIINPPEAAILAIGGAAQVPVVKDGQLAIGWRMKATISADHRVTDGAEAAKFMQALAKGLEEPLRLMV
ncbi:MAG: 2-oxo acid dehydrogenase subunit E2 [Anaerolineales bacterium]|nr:2-oxo acid dehydrogenase subunit E2 [Anaerolineales bacterium]